MTKKTKIRQNLKSLICMFSKLTQSFEKRYSLEAQTRCREVTMKMADNKCRKEK